MSGAGRFAPKEPVNLPPPKDDPISAAHLAECDGTTEGQPTLVAIKGKVFDVTGNPTYAVGGKYHFLAGKDGSRALAKMSFKPEDVLPQYDDLTGEELKVLNDWVTFFEKRYAVVGFVEGSGASL